MIEISFVSLELAFAAVWLLARIFVWIRQKRIVWKREAVLLLLYLSLAVIIRFVFFPRDTVRGQIQPLVFDPSAVFPFHVNYVPFVNFSNFKTAEETLWNVGGNVVMFIPLGVVLPFVYKSRRSFGKVVATGALISLCVETIQLLFASRTTDIDDLILNTLGVMIGYGIYALSKSRGRQAADASGEGKTPGAQGNQKR